MVVLLQSDICGHLMDLASCGGVRIGKSFSDKSISSENSFYECIQFRLSTPLFLIQV
jgi:hypothetical protein